MRTLWAVAALLAATAAAMAGDLKYIPFVQADAIDVAGIRIYVNQFGKMPDDSGAVSPNAVCATLPNGNISIAVDAD